MTADEWYSNKELFEMFRKMQKSMDELSQEMARTTTLIRDYNGLREKLGELERKVSTLQSARQAGRDYTGWIFALVAAIIAAFSYLGK